MTYQRAFLLIAMVISISAIGCSDGGVPRNNLAGTVTYEGKPVPAGRIMFRPDRSKGGKGPAGFAQIVDGKYDTSSSGKGAITGPVEVSIEGFVSNQPLAPAMFVPYKTTTDVSGDAEEVDFVVPEGTAPPKSWRVPAKRDDG